MELLDCSFPWASRAVSTKLRSSARELICSAVRVGEEKTDPDMLYSCELQAILMPRFKYCKFSTRDNRNLIRYSDSVNLAFVWVSDGGGHTTNSDRDAGPRRRSAD